MTRLVNTVMHTVIIGISLLLLLTIKVPRVSRLALKPSLALLAGGGMAPPVQGLRWEHRPGLLHPYRIMRAGRRVAQYSVAHQVQWPTIGCLSFSQVGLVNTRGAISGAVKVVLPPSVVPIRFLVDIGGST